MASNVPTDSVRLVIRVESIYHLLFTEVGYYVIQVPYYLPRNFKFIGIPATLSRFSQCRGCFPYDRLMYIVGTYLVLLKCTYLLLHIDVHPYSVVSAKPGEKKAEKKPEKKAATPAAGSSSGATTSAPKPAAPKSSKTPAPAPEAAAKVAAAAAKTAATKQPAKGSQPKAGAKQPAKGAAKPAAAAAGAKGAAAPKKSAAKPAAKVNDESILLIVGWYIALTSILIWRSLSVTYAHAVFKKHRA